MLVNHQPATPNAVAGSVSHQAHQFVAGLPASATTDGEQRTLRALADHHNHRSGLIFPSLGTMSARTGFPVRTLRRHYAKFLEQGWLVVLDARRQVMAFPTLLKTPWKTCGKAVEGVPGGSGAEHSRIPDADPVRPLLALCDDGATSSGADQDLDQDLNRKRTEGAAAPPPVDDDALRMMALERARQVLKAQLPASPRRRARA